eukprot:TRINITY_DN2472_c0_g1_i1.p1 TRINITY_DN2472_c0_g1~~TRINITY_DN2472_c0_g1_i1.p1  ORF type:complete len:228 (+),score=84.97 TRINITY_DN2472_c0_g1_i1:47-685(+)
MEYIKSFFWWSAEPAKPVPKESPYEKLSNTIDTMDRREQVLENRIQDETKRAKEYLAKKDQKRAMACLKKKKLYEQQLHQLQDQKFNLEQLQVTSQNAAIQQDIIRVQQDVTREMNRNAPKIEEVEAMQDELNDALDKNREVAEALARPLAGGVEYDDVLEDLAALQQEQADEQFMRRVAKNAPAKPVATQVDTQAEEDEEEDEKVLAELTA